jgi:hypothetical protein
MPGRHFARRPLAAAGFVGLVGLVAGCSSSSSSGTGSGAATSSSAPAQTMTSQVACDKFYAFDLFRRTNVTTEEQTEGLPPREALQKYLDLASSAAVSLDSAVTVGDLPPKARANADRIVRRISLVSKAGGDISDVSGGVDATIGTSADRIEKLCVATSHPVPQDNLDAREKARAS